MVVIASLTFLGFCLLVLGLLSGPGSLAVVGGALMFCIPAAATVFYAWQILFRPPQH